MSDALMQKCELYEKKLDQAEREKQELVEALAELAYIDEYTGGDCPYCAGSIDTNAHTPECPIPKARAELAKHHPQEGEP